MYNTRLLFTSSSGWRLSRRELRDVLEPLGRPFDPRAFAVALYLARGAIARTVLELDVQVVYGALMRYCRARGDAALLLRVDVEDVVEPP